jgi:hypothetical protein
MTLVHSKAKSQNTWLKAYAFSLPGLHLWVVIAVMAGMFYVTGCSLQQDDAGEPNYADAGVADTNMVEPNVGELHPTDANAADVNEAVAIPVDTNVVDVNKVITPLEANAVDVNVVDVNAVDANAVDVNAVDVNVGEVNTVQLPDKVTFHDVCADSLGRFVDDKGMVKYRLLDHRKGQIEAILEKFAKLKRDEYESWPREDKVAFWINACNIEMLRVIVDNYPIESTRFKRFFYWPPDDIRHIEPVGIFGVTKWDRYKLIVMEEEFSLSEIERRFFRKEFNEPRVFFALTHATLSGPPLRNEPYYGYKLSEQLDDQVRRFLSSRRAFRIDRERKVVYISAIFQATWYGREFIAKYGTEKKFKKQQPATRAALNFISNYISPKDKSFIEKESCTVSYIGYDWRLNDGSEKPDK